ncbi:pre-mRNA-splicing factor CWC25-like [Dioscorea cayenensis subsp. rotundata]|uniref:Pre-mRNA-splicing factor CWC25-like n=1 Tax=Dioscorea cayennensis subsp. rotundata TaxID=55577 RepID=A0AB40CVS0_DIOCR|nr:pre-mRNA-splicing factor CWC25-like [Dioscorea cayenensis subsp. rotundata]
MNKGTTKLDEILSVGRTSKGRHGIGYIGESSSVKTEDSGVVFVKSKQRRRRRQRRKDEDKEDGPPCSTDPTRNCRSITEVRMRGTDSEEAHSRREESKDLGKAIVPYVSSQDVEVRETETSSQDLPSGVKDRDDLLRWVRESFPGAYVQRAEEDEQEDSTTVLVGEGSEEQQARDEDAVEKKANRAQAEETVGERSTDAPTSAKEEVATILSEVLGDLHRHAEAPTDTDHITGQVTTTPATSKSSHSSDEIPFKDRVAQITKGKKVVSEKKAQSRKKILKKEKVSKSKRKSFSDPEVEASPRHKKRCTEAAKQGEKPSASSKKEKKKKATQQAKDSDEDRFYDKASNKKFEYVEGRGVVVERMIDEGAFEKYGLASQLRQRSLYKSATFP